MKIAFSFVGGMHQFLHGAPVAAVLSRRPGLMVEAYVSTPRDGTALSALLARLGGERVRIVEMRLPSFLQRIAARRGGAVPLKMLRLVRWAARMRNTDAIVALERTSAILKLLPGRCPPLIQIPHGAGDRAKGYDRRLRRFDYALVAGEKDRARLVEMGLLGSAHVFSVGYIKLAALRRMQGKERPVMLDPGRPTILYNPHFDRSLSSWPEHGKRIIEAIVADGRWNLIVAPHVRLFAGSSPAERASLEALSEPGRVLCDLGSERCSDMTYTLAADIYIGDVSSQVYEFCTEPRPCIFFDAHGADWRDNVHYAMWHLGQVIGNVTDLIPALERIDELQPVFDPLQREAVRLSLGDPSQCADEVAADRIMALVGGGAGRISV